MSNQSVYPYTQTPTTSGMCLAAHLMHRNAYYVSAKNGTNKTEMDHSYYAYNEVSNTTSEFARETFEYGDDGKTTCYSLGIANDDTTGTRTIHGALQSMPASTVFSMLKDNTQMSAVTEAQLDGGISWSRDDASLYFGKDKSFRIRYRESESAEIPARLTIECYNVMLDSYSIQIEFST
jgi:hypothetical protein